MSETQEQNKNFKKIKKSNILVFGEGGLRTGGGG